METAQQPAIPVPQDPEFSISQGVMTVDETGQTILPPNNEAIYRCITLQSETDSAFVSFSDENPGSGVGIALTPNSPRIEFFIDSKLKLWARNRIWVCGGGASVTVSFIEISFEGK